MCVPTHKATCDMFLSYPYPYAGPSPLSSSAHISLCATPSPLFLRPHLSSSACRLCPSTPPPLSLRPSLPVSLPLSRHRISPSLSSPLPAPLVSVRRLMEAPCGGRNAAWRRIRGDGEDEGQRERDPVSLFPKSSPPLSPSAYCRRI